MDTSSVIDNTHITIRSLSKNFGGVQLFSDFNLDIPKGKIISIFGPNGCGKSTLINMMSGIQDFNSGQILFGGKTLQDTRIGYVFQNYREAVFPWLTALENLYYPLKFLKLTESEKKLKVEKIVSSFDVKFDLNSYPYQLSGGQQQSISIMRALIVDPEVLFLDEPFSALDYEMTLFMREQLQKIFIERQTTTLLVSHDLEDAVYLADKVLLLTRKPTQVAAFLNYLAPRPRTVDVLSSEEFMKVKTESLNIFLAQVNNV